MAMEIEVIRSSKRRKTVSARVADGVLRISIPSWMSKAEEKHWVDDMYRRFERRARTTEIDLTARAKSLSAKYGYKTPASIKWSYQQDDRWGSCTPDDATIRISAKLSREPLWVLDYVIVHELAHLTIPAHNPKFWLLVDRYPKSERARGFLIARELQPIRRQRRSE